MQSDGSPPATQIESTLPVSFASQTIVCPARRELAKEEETKTLPNAGVLQNIAALPLQRMAWANEINDEALLLALDTDDEALLGIMLWPRRRSIL